MKQEHTDSIVLIANNTCYVFSTDQLETLIPKAEGGVVMVVRGGNTGQLGRLVARDKGR